MSPEFNPQILRYLRLNLLRDSPPLSAHLLRHKKKHPPATFYYQKLSDSLFPRRRPL